MSVFRYDKEMVRNWATKINGLISGGGDSFRESFYKFIAQMEIMVEPGTWTGSAAAKNFQNMDETLGVMIRFSNEFGTGFTSAIKSVNDAVADLEINNLGTDTDVANALNSLEYQNIKDNSGNITVQKDLVTYNKEKLAEVTSNLTNIKSNMSSLSSKLTSDLEQLNNGTGMWDGELAERTKESLTSVAQRNLDTIIENLGKCISNVEQATEAARQFDANMGNSFSGGSSTGVSTAATASSATVSTSAQSYSNPAEAMNASLQSRGVTHEQSVAMENTSVTGSYYGPASSQQQASVETLSSTNANMGSVSSMGPGAGLTDEMRRQAIAEDNARVASEALAKKIFKE